MRARPARRIPPIRPCMCRCGVIRPWPTCRCRASCALVGIELLEDAIDLPSFRHPLNAAYVLGPERAGLSAALLERCDHIIRIPTRFALNLAVAGALVLYDRLLQHGRFPDRPGGFAEALCRRCHQPATGRHGSARQYRTGCARSGFTPTRRSHERDALVPRTRRPYCCAHEHPIPLFSDHSRCCWPCPPPPKQTSRRRPSTLRRTVQNPSASSTTGRRRPIRRRGKPFVTPSPGRRVRRPRCLAVGGVVLTVTERPSGRDAVAIEAGFAYAPNATVTVQVDQTGLEFYTSGQQRFRPGRQGGRHRVRQGDQSHRSVPGPEGSDRYLQPERLWPGVCGDRQGMSREVSDLSEADRARAFWRSRRCSTRLKSCWPTGGAIWSAWTVPNWQPRWRQSANRRSASSSCGTGSTIRASPISLGCPRSPSRCRPDWRSASSSAGPEAAVVQTSPSTRPANGCSGSATGRRRRRSTSPIPPRTAARSVFRRRSAARCLAGSAIPEPRRWCAIWVRRRSSGSSWPRGICYGEWPSPKGETPRLLSTIVLMGMGEPLYNYTNVAKAMKIVMDGEGIGLSRRRITLSTSGVVPMMDRAGRNWG